MKLKGSLSIYEVNNLRKQFINALKENDGIEIDLNSVSECDTAGIQLLYSAQKTAVKTGKKVNIKGVSQSVSETVFHLGIDPEGIFI